MASVRRARRRSATRLVEVLTLELAVGALLDVKDPEDLQLGSGELLEAAGKPGEVNGDGQQPQFVGNDSTKQAGVDDCSGTK